MPVTYPLDAKTQRLTLTRDRMIGKLPAPATGSASNPVLVIGTSALSGATGVLVVIPLPSAGLTVSGAQLSLIAAAQSATASGTGTAALAEIRRADGTVETSGLTVGTAGADVIVGTTAISAGQTVTVTAAAITHA